MLRRVRLLALTAGVVMALQGCATGLGGGEGSVSFSVGEGYGDFIYGTALDVLRDRHGYNIDREREPPNLMIRTSWRERNPTDDEEQAGYDRVRSRFIVEARPSRRDQQEGDHLYRASLQGENQVRESGGDWEDRATDGFESYAREMADDLRNEIDMRYR